MREMLDAALTYARRGWPVFPCSPDSKQPLVPKESRPGARDGGLYLASVDADQMKAWWTRWPKAMIGLRTGRAIGAFVVDLDPRRHKAEDMSRALASWLDVRAFETATCQTQSGGLHLYFALPPDVEIRNRAGLFLQVPDVPEEMRNYVDVRGEGGYVIVPPSVTSAGTFYDWLSPPDSVSPMPAPQRLIDAILKRLDRKGEAAMAASPSGAAKSTVESDDRLRRNYALAALDRETRALCRVGEGARGFELNKAAFTLGGFVGAGVLSETVALAELLRACEANGLAAKDGGQKTLDNINRSLAQGAARPIDLGHLKRRAVTSSDGRRRRTATAATKAPLPAVPLDLPPPEADDALDVLCAALPMTDLGNAQRFVARHGRDFLHVNQWGWMAWDGRRWNGQDADAMVQRAVHGTVRAIADEARAIRLYQALLEEREGSEARPAVNPILDVRRDRVVRLADRLTGWCHASQGNAHISCLSKLAQHYLTAGPESFDADALAFNVSNGTLRFARRDEGDYVSFHPHVREDRMTKISPVIFDREAACPRYDAFLARVHPPTAADPEAGAKMIRHLHAWGGVSLTALKIPKLSFWYGTGRNGKSVLADTWAHVLGDYVQTIPIESFLDSGRARRGGEASPDIASLPGVRMLRTSEPEKRSKLAESLIKAVTGGEPLRARHLNRDFFEFTPMFKLIMQGNYKPSIEGTDEGIWTRIALVPWTVLIPEAERDPLLAERLKTEASGILNRLLDGLRDYLDHGLSPPEAVHLATRDYREDSDPIGRFIADCTAPELRARTPGGELYRLYRAWCGANGEPKWSAKALKRGLADHGIRAMKSSSMFYLDIVATRTPASFDGLSFDEPDDEERRR